MQYTSLTAKAEASQEPPTTAPKKSAKSSTAKANPHNSETAIEQSTATQQKNM
jgi:hypothetical protein